MKIVRYLSIGILFGIVLTKTQVTSWYKIIEMFRFQSFHMYGVIGSAILIGALGLFLLTKFGVKDFDGEPITIQKIPMAKNFLFGGILFGMGWALSGTCPGPMYANVGIGYPVFIIMLLAATLGTFVFGLLKNKLPF